MKKILLLAILGVLVLAGCKEATEKEEPGVDIMAPITVPLEEKKESEEELAVIACQKAFKEKQALGEDMSNGPCLSNEIVPNWVCDVAHSPREPVDNQPENQCSAFREGKAKHFVELDLNGELIKTH